MKITDPHTLFSGSMDVSVTFWHRFAQLPMARLDAGRTRPSVSEWIYLLSGWRALFLIPVPLLLTLAVSACSDYAPLREEQRNELRNPL